MARTPEADAEALRTAMKGAGTDEDAIIAILATRTCAQRLAIKLKFKSMFGKDLVDELKSELGGKFEDVVLACMMPLAEYEATELHRAVSGLGTKESTLIEILASRTHRELTAIKDAYKKLFKKELEEDLEADTSGHFKRLLISLATAAREEDGTVDHGRAQDDAQELLDAGEAQWGTDESRFNVVLASRSFYHLAVVFDEYERISDKTMEAVVKGEFSGDVEDGFLAVVKCVRSRPAYFAERLYKSMKGMGTDDQMLIRLVVTRAEKDMDEVKASFARDFGKTLASFIEGDCSGDYKKMLLALIDE